MNMTSGIRPLLGLALVMTGCGKAEIEYRHSSTSTEEGNHQWHEHTDTPCFDDADVRGQPIAMSVGDAW